MKKLITFIAMISTVLSLSVAESLIGKTEKAQNKDVEVGQDLIDRGYTKIKIPKGVDKKVIIENTTGELVVVDIFEQDSKNMIGKIVEGALGKNYEEEPEHAKTIKVSPDKPYKKNPCSDDIDDMDAIYVKILSEKDFEIIDEGNFKDNLKLIISAK
ncbi:MAG: hypothetical protein MJZ50_05450 [Treponema sp.]|nr:hypothetical protein [Treponema sp.]